MKKHLVAAAVAAAIAVPAVAQNVSISGRIDTSFGKATNTSDQSSTRVNSSVLTTNQIVISGSEDLGGGLKANFNMTTGFASDAQNETTVDQASTDKSVSTFRLGDRGMQVGVSGAFGEVAVGRTVGTMANSTTGSGVTGNIGNQSPLIARPDNMISYTLPTFNGVTLRAIYGAGSEVAGANKNRQTELSAQYANGPLLVRLATGKYKDVSVATLVSTNVFGTVGTASTLTDSEVTENSAQVDYDAKVVKFNLRVHQRDHKDSGNLTKDIESYGIGAAIPLGNGVTAAIDYLDNDVNSSNGDSDVTSAAIIKDLSKRTNVYFAIAQKSYQDTAKRDEKLSTVGIRHSF
jgi:predicted porin